MITVEKAVKTIEEAALDLEDADRHRISGALLTIKKVFGAKKA